jgi:hypothetical protein
MVDGRILKQGSKLTTIDEPKLVREANETITRVRAAVKI